MTDIIPRIHAGSSAGGQFADHDRTDADATLPALTTEQLDTIRTALLADYAAPDLVFIEQGEQLDEQNIALYLAGDWSTLDENIDELYDERRYMSALEQGKAVVTEVGLDWGDMSEEDQDEVKDLIYDRDSSNPVRELVKATPRQLMRAPLPTSLDEAVFDFQKAHPDRGVIFYDDKNWERQHSDRVAILAGVLASSGVATTPEVAAALDTIVTEGPSTWHEAVRFDIIWYGDIDDAGFHPSDDGSQRRITFDQPHVVLIDTVNGSGYEEVIPAEVTTTLTRDNPARLDSPKRGIGYGWDDTAGVHYPAYAVNNIQSDLVHL